MEGDFPKIRYKYSTALQAITLIFFSKTTTTNNGYDYENDYDYDDDDDDDDDDENREVVGGHVGRHR
ncbi:uncharacterized protein Triagg1_9452 [Trichoderma aggressivum f. europaeum]|uniref:Uncharacterized protein n=1 Tax=Trichoderma aggressivum f. europaeum TaxID=173218 RepID=A0AAE1I713_9HYPO|nr:hypothetical protein Triagg1_9452 [Trichoderma aggressivum f. europaeum]